MSCKSEIEDLTWLINIVQSETDLPLAIDTPNEEAMEEGEEEIAKMFTEVGEVEEKHAIRYQKLLENLEKGEVFKKDEVKRWKCNNCGYIHEGDEAPEKCPACSHPQGYFEIFIETY